MNRLTAEELQAIEDRAKNTSKIFEINGYRSSELPLFIAVNDVHALLAEVKRLQKELTESQRRERSAVEDLKKFGCLSCKSMLLNDDKPPCKDCWRNGLNGDQTEDNWEYSGEKEGE